jgi:ABC-type amino acid transport system permease subunit
MSKLRLVEVLCVIGMIDGFFVGVGKVASGGLVFAVCLILLIIFRTMRFIWKD